MAMIAPLVPMEVVDGQYSLWIALLCGIGMGFFLERAGFGSARKLTGQFYFYDMTVFKVMFTAIITAMTGIYLLSAAGIMSLEEVSFVPTFLRPQILGGLVLGAGFVIGGYCPGTSIVAAVTGKVDAMVYVLGVFAGMFVFAEIYPSVEALMSASAMGKQTLYEYFGIPYEVVVVLVLLMAGAGFWGATWAEKKFAE